jgi:cytochrome c oxidase subunit 4
MSHPKGSHQGVSIGENIAVFCFLILMTLITVGSSQFDLGPGLNIFFTLVIATLKSCAVMYWFMHLKFESMYNRLAFLSGFLILFILFFVSFIDIWSR